MRQFVLAVGLLLAACSSAPPAIQKNPALDLTQWQSPDADFSEAWIDIDEWRSAPVPHRYIHGGFENTDTRFSLHFPLKGEYTRRFFQYITPVPDSETKSQGATGEDDKIGFALSHGAMFIETNGGGRGAMAVPGSGINPTIGAYRANAAVARLSRTLAQQIYGKHRIWGYAFGGSGGAYRTIGGLENTDGAWDGAVPFVMGSPMAIPNVFSARMYGLRVLADKLPAIADAVDAGGGDPYAGLNDEEAAALREVTGMGFPLRAWTLHEGLDLHAFSVLYPTFLMADAGYFEDFWRQPGYEGHALPTSLKKSLVQHRTQIVELLSAQQARAQGLKDTAGPGMASNLADTAWQSVQEDKARHLPVAMRVATVPEPMPLGMDVYVGDAVLPAAKIEGKLVWLSSLPENVRRGLAVGDRVEFNNANMLAMQTYHRHQVPGPEYGVWDQFRNAEGNPIYPQRPMLFGPLFTQKAAGTVPTGRFKGKMILVENLFDTEAFAWQGAWYHDRVREQLGDNTDQQFRLWFVDRATHGDYSLQKYPTQTVSYLGVLQQALLDLSDWVERGVEPPPTSRYRIENGQVILPESAMERAGVQPVVRLIANGAERADVGLGESVALRAEIETPDGASLVKAEWDLDGSGNFATPARWTKTDKGRWVVDLRHAYASQGTRFVTLRVTSQRESDARTPYTRLYNLARARVVVH